MVPGQSTIVGSAPRPPFSVPTLDAVTREPDVNVVGGELLPCSTDPMTGFYREGCCSTGPEDLGSHTVCVVLTEAFLEFSRAVGNDLSTPRPEWGFDGLQPATAGASAPHGGSRPTTPAAHRRSSSAPRTRARSRSSRWRRSPRTLLAPGDRVSVPGWVALLRGINVGGRNSVPMADLKKLFETSGCVAVRTYIQSGNVLFAHELLDRSTLGRLLEAAVSESFRRRGDGGASDVRRDRQGGAGGAVRPRRLEDRRHVPGDEADGGAAIAFESLDIAPDRITIAGDDVFLHYPSGVSGARLTGARLERELGVPGTARNWRTVTRLAELARHCTAG